MSAGNVFAAAAAVITFAVTGSPHLAMVAWTAGNIAGNLLFPEQVEGPRLQDLKAQSSEYGRPIPIVYGTIALGGNVIWASDLIEVANEEGGKGGPEVTIYSYFANFAVAICEGEVSLGRIWAGPDKRLIWDGAILEGAESGALMRFYSGTEDQLPDALIESYMGAGQVPAYRGTAYVVFENFPVEKDGNRIPFLTVEVGRAESSSAPEELGAVWISKVIVSEADNLYFAFYNGTYYGVVIRYLNDNTLYAHYTYSLSEWTTSDRFFIDRTNSRIVLWLANSLEFWAIDWTTGTRTTHTFSAPGGADADRGTGVFGAYMHNGSYVFVATGGSTSDRITVYLVDPGTLACTAAYSGATGAPTGQGKIARAPHDSSAYLYVMSGTGTGTPESDGTLTRMQIASGLAATDLGEPIIFGGGVKFEVDPDTGYLWLGVKHSDGSFRVSAHSPTAGLLQSWNIADAGWHEIHDLFFDGSQVIFAGNRWLATDYFYVFQADASAAYASYTGGYSGTAEINQMIYNPVTGKYQAFRDGGWITFGEPSDPTTVNYLDPVTSARESDSKYLGEADGSVQPQGQPLSEIVLDLSERAGLTADQINVTALTDTVDGYAIANQMDVRSAVMALAPAYFFDAVESGGLVKYVKRGGAIAAVIDDDELGAYESGSQPVEDLETTRIMDEELPRIVTARYLLEATKYDAATKIAKRLVGHSGSEAALDLPLVLTDTKAQEVAEVNLHGPWVARLTYRFSLPRKYAYLEPTDIIVVKGYTMRIATIKQTGGRYQCEAVHDEANVYVPNVVVTETVPPPSAGVATIPATVLELM